ncbi:MAG TPA: flagellar basal body rod protein FlgB [Pseudolabrys sp.]|nr:flagellar basal body rod protein FlgB [Pseudolabrys sp.]
MAITDIPVLSMLRTRMQWAQQRQRVLAENVANADTRGFRPRDLVPPKFEAPSQGPSAPLTAVALMRTEGSHLPGIGQEATPFRAKRDDKYEMRPTGNSVNLEQEMMKVASNQMEYQAVTALYTRSLGLLKTALGKG